MSDITPYDIAHVIGVLLDRTHTNDWGMIGAHVSDEVLHIDLTPRDGNALHFRAVVVEGETAPIVLPRVDVERNDDMRGDRYGVENRPPADGWYVFGDDHVIFGGTGHISPAEARRFAAALVSQADAVEAARAEQGGDR